MNNAFKSHYNYALFFALTALFSTTAHALDITSRCTETSESSCTVSSTVTLKPNEQVYASHILVSQDHEHLTLTWHTDPDPMPLEQPYQQEPVLGFNATFVIEATVTSTITPAPSDAQLHISINPTKGTPLIKQIPLTFEKNVSSNHLLPSSTTSAAVSLETPIPHHETNTTVSSAQPSWAQRLEHSFIHSDSPFFKLLLAFLLGLLLSLTPCIYPMIPITVGVLQSQGNKSMLSNFLLALMYTLGLAMTFSLMGLIAATTGNAFGYLMGNPLFILCIMSLLAYFALSMFGFYNLYIPRFMQQKQSLSRSGSYLSVFLFGLASGTFASPCLSPGLLLILTAVSSLKSTFLGFLLLFVFGIGISTPLLVIGTFSGSMNVLPRAGMWMIEVQKMFGFMLFGMCFYYLQPIASEATINGLLTIFMATIGIYYLRAINANDTAIWKTIKTVLGIIGLAFSLLFCTITIQKVWYPEQTTAHNWYTDYDQAISEAQRQGKRVILDFWTPYCSICKEITAKIFKHPSMAPYLEPYIIVAIDAKDAQAEPFKTLRSRYDIKGVPDIIIIEPENGAVIKRWHGELYSQSKDVTIEELKQAAH